MIFHEEYYLGAPVTSRKASVLAISYGYGVKRGNIEALSDDIPPKAEVADFGAGLSDLGLEVCRLRPDIRWTNVDVSYVFPDIRARLPEFTPENLTYIAADVLDPDAIELGRYDRVFSWFMLGHIALAGKPEVRGALRNILSSANRNGRVMLGPVRGRKISAVGLEAPQTLAELTRQVGVLEPIIPMPKLAALIHKASNSKIYSKRYQAGPLSKNGSNAFIAPPTSR
jgi:hypothetical protein